MQQYTEMNAFTVAMNGNGGGYRFSGGLAVMLGYGIYMCIVWHQFPQVGQYSQELQQVIRELLLQYKEKGKTILIASHISEDIDILCDHIINLNIP